MNPYDFTRRQLDLAGGQQVSYYSLRALEEETGTDLGRLPFSLKVLLESLLRLQDHPAYEPHHVDDFLQWKPDLTEQKELPFMPARVLLQDFTGVPCVVDLATLRTTMQRAGKDPSAIEPLIPVDLIIDHSVGTDEAGHPEAMNVNMRMEFERNRERYLFLRWGQKAFSRLRVFPPGLGICHQINMEYLATCVTLDREGTEPVAYPDTLVGTDSHTTMVNSMGVVGWGVGGIEAEAAMLGQPIPILTPRVTGVRLHGEKRPGVTATDIALHMVEMLRKIGVVDQFVEFFGPGLDQLSLADRAPIANMAPEYGATMGFFPMDEATAAYLRESGRDEAQVDLVERYARAQGLWREPGTPDPQFNRVVEVDLSTVEPCVAGPRRPQQRVPLRLLGSSFTEALPLPVKEQGFAVPVDRIEDEARTESHGVLRHGSVVLASIASCTNTSNPSLILGAALLARNAVARGMRMPACIKTSFSPGSRVVTAYLERAGLIEPLETLGFHVVSFGCAACIGNSGPLAPDIELAIREKDLVVAAVISSNRNFEGRVHPLTKANYLASPQLVVAYALAGRVDINLETDALGTDAGGHPVYLRDLWPDQAEVDALLAEASDRSLYHQAYADMSGAGTEWEHLPAPGGDVYEWNAESTYVREPPFFDGFTVEPAPLTDVESARVLCNFGDFITTDHISPAGSIPKDSPAARYLREQGVEPGDFNSFGARRGNHEVMMRGTFANIRIRNLLASREGGYTRHHTSGEEMPVYDAAMRYKAEGIPLVVLAGKMYGAGSSRDWAAKGTLLLGVRAVIAENFERIHRSNLVEMGVLPLEFVAEQTADSLGLDGRETFHISLASLNPGGLLTVRAVQEDGREIVFETLARVDSAIEMEYLRHGGIMPYVLREIMRGN